MPVKRPSSLSPEWWLVHIFMWPDFLIPVLMPTIFFHLPMILVPNLSAYALYLYYSRVSFFPFQDCPTLHRHSKYCRALCIKHTVLFVIKVSLVVSLCCVLYGIRCKFSSDISFWLVRLNLLKDQYSSHLILPVCDLIFSGNPKIPSRGNSAG